jgi:hypothetical protein
MADVVDSFLNPSSKFTLRDGRERVFEFTYNSLMIYELARKNEIKRGLIDPVPKLVKRGDQVEFEVSLAEIRLLFFAGMYDDAQAHGEGEQWTPDYVGRLLPRDMRELQQLATRAASLRKLAVVGPGESKARVDAGKNSARKSGRRR